MMSCRPWQARTLVAQLLTLPCALAALLVAPPADAQRQPVLKQIAVPHPYYFREMYLPQLTSVLEGKHRAGHFKGVCLVVAKLFNIVQPQVACFGQKDYQQYLILKAMAESLDWPGLASDLDTEG